MNADSESVVSHVQESNTVSEEEPLESQVKNELNVAGSTMISARSTLTSRIPQLRTPWVPAPGKSSNKLGDTVATQDKALSSSVPAFSSSSSSYSSLKIRPKPVTAPVHGQYGHGKDEKKARVSSTSLRQKYKKDQHRQTVRQPTSRLKTVKHRERRPASSYKLQSKDSLVDVTACLQAKRADVMKLWEKSLMRDDPRLLSQIENTNRLAVQAAEEVESLRNIIQSFQRKERGLSEEDCLQLDKMRAKVLEKVREFEAADNELQEIIARRSVSKTSIISASSQRSQNELDGTMNLSSRKQDVHASDSAPMLSLGKPHSSLSTKDDVIFLKQKVDNFSDESISEHDGKNFTPSKTKHGRDKEYDGSCVASEVASILSLGRLKLMYDEHLTFPPLNDNEEIKMGNNRKTSSSEAKPSQSQRTVRFMDRELDDDGVSFHEETTMGDLYREKVSVLQRKLMDTEEEVVELKSEIERIESEANFRVRMLQNSVQDKFESLKVIPEYLHVVDHKLYESMQVKTKLELDLREKEVSLREQQEFNRSMRNETENMREKLKAVENSRDALLLKNVELEKSNHQLRKEVEDITRQMAIMQSQILGLQGNQAERNSPGRQPPRVISSSSLERNKLKLQCTELKDMVAQYRRIVHSLKKSKIKSDSRLNQRIEELIAALEKSQDHKRQLCDQIRFLKKSYDELFPIDLFNMPMQKKSSHSRLQRKKKPVIEPKIASKVYWQTGSDVERPKGKPKVSHVNLKSDSFHHIEHVLPSKGASGKEERKE